MDRPVPLCIVTLWTLMTFWLNGCYTELREYCFPNAFNASCPPDSVIVVTSARYGRMERGGKCLTSDYNVGCWANVLHQMDRKCSGRRHCIVSIPDTTLHNLQPCQKDLLGYLETDYTCQKVENRTASLQCRFYGDLIVEARASGRPTDSGSNGDDSKRTSILSPLTISSTSSPLSSTGYLASIVTEEHGLGSARCPWIITAPRGQRINITLIDFGLASRFEDVDASSGSTGSGEIAAGMPYGNSGGSVCHIYAKIQEPGLTGSSANGVGSGEVVICGSRFRQRSVYVSETNRVEITIINYKVDDEPVYYLLKYEAIGCTDPQVPRGATMSRTGEKAVITCNATSQAWHIVCQGSQWYGKVDNCTNSAGGGYSPKTSNLSLTAKDRFPYGLPVAVVTGLIVGVLLGVAMLAIVIACLKRRKIPALRCAHDLLTGTPMVAMTPTMAYISPGAGDKSTGGPASGSTGTCRRPDHHRHHHYCGNSGSGGTGGLTTTGSMGSISQYPVTVEYGYAHICGVGGLPPPSSTSVVNQTGGGCSQIRHGPNCSHHHHQHFSGAAIHRRCSMSNTSLDQLQLEDFRVVGNGDMSISANTSTATGSHPPPSSMMTTAIGVFQAATVYDRPGLQRSMQQPNSTTVEFRVPSNGSQHFSTAGRFVTAGPVPTGNGGRLNELGGGSGDDEVDEAHQVLQPLAAYCQDVDLLAVADADSIPYWHGVAA